MWRSISRFFEGLMIGGAAGYLLGLLSAPKSGAELRKEIADNSEDLYRQAGDQLTDLKGKTEHALQDLQQTSAEALKKASATVAEKKVQLASKLEEITGQGAKVLVDEEKPVADMTP